MFDEIPSTSPLLDPGWEVAWRAKRLQAAERLRAALSCVPFYAKRAERALLETGDEMTYWLELQGSEATLRRP